MRPRGLRTGNREETARELGLQPDQIIKLASNENPLGPSPKAKSDEAAIEEGHLYPDRGGWKLRNAIAEKHESGWRMSCWGTDRTRSSSCSATPFSIETALIAAEHAFVVYKLMATLFGAKYVEVPDPGFVHDLDAMADAINGETRLVFIANPNNPTGTLVGEEAIERFMDRLPEHVVAVFDEAYHEFLENPPDTVRYVREGRNVCVIGPFPRRGFGGPPDRVWARVPFGRWSPAQGPATFQCDAVAQSGALAALLDDEHVARTVETNNRGWSFSIRLSSPGLRHVQRGEFRSRSGWRW